jgi:hypothetical protein
MQECCKPTRNPPFQDGEKYSQTNMLFQTFSVIQKWPNTIALFIIQIVRETIERKFGKKPFMK